MALKLRYSKPKTDADKLIMKCQIKMQITPKIVPLMGLGNPFRES